MRVPVSFLALMFVGATLHAQQCVVSGVVRDEKTHDVLPGATVRVTGTALGSISNRHGKYSLTLSRGRVEITATYIGYTTARTTLSVDSSQTFDIALTPSPVQLGSTTVYAKNAEAIVRRAIAEKRKTLASVHSYQFDAYTKTTVLADQPGNVAAGSNSVRIGIGGGDSASSALKVATILESFSTGFWREGDGLREVVKQRRQTANIPQEQNLNAVFIIYNFNDDEQRLGKYVLTGPTAPDALDVYDYELLDVTEMFGHKVYRLRMTPKNASSALWSGIVSIADSTWNVVEVNVRPNAVVNFPFVDSLRYSQSFVAVDSVHWMPANIDITADVMFNMLFVKAKLQLDHVSVLSNYIVNGTIPDTVFEQDRIAVDSSATKFDSSYWRVHEVMPLTAEEQESYILIDSIQKADTGRRLSLAQSVLGGIFGLPFRLSEPPFTGFSDTYHANRVEGNALGLGMTAPWASTFPYTTLTGKISYGFSDKRSKWYGGLSQWIPLGKHGGIGADARIYRSLAYRPDADFYTTGDITVLSLVEGSDYRNYFYADGWSAGMSFSYRTLDGALKFLAEDESSASKHTDLFSGANSLPVNPAIATGTLRGLVFDAHVGPGDPVEARSSAARLGVNVEIADRNIFGGSFTYTRTAATLLSHLRTSSFGFLDSRITAGVAAGTLPPQKLFAVESGIGSFAPFGVMRGMTSQEFAGDRFASVAAQENLGDWVFRKIGEWTAVPFIEYSGMELMIDAGAAWSTASDAARAISPVPINTAQRVYGEAGFGINRILTVFRFDLTWRLNHRFDTGNVLFTITAAVF